MNVQTKAFRLLRNALPPPPTPTTFESLMNAMIQYSYDNQDGDGDECVDNDLDSNFLVSL